MESGGFGYSEYLQVIENDLFDTQGACSHWTSEQPSAHAELSRAPNRLAMSSAYQSSKSAK